MDYEDSEEYNDLMREFMDELEGDEPIQEHSYFEMHFAEEF